MSFVSGLGTPNYTIPVQRNTTSSTASSSTTGSSIADFLSLNDSTAPGSVANIASVANQQNADSQQSDQDREEAFAKLMVTLQNPGASQTGTTGSSSTDSSNALSSVTGASSTGSSSTDPTQEFQDYMSLTPGQQMRYSAMKNMGLSEDSLKAMSPDQQAKIKDKMADMIKKQTEAQANASGTTAPSGSANGSSTGSNSDNLGSSYLTNALSQMTQSATDASANLGLG